MTDDEIIALAKEHGMGMHLLRRPVLVRYGDKLRFEQSEHPTTFEKNLLAFARALLTAHIDASQTPV